MRFVVIAASLCLAACIHYQEGVACGTTHASVCIESIRTPKRTFPVASRAATQGIDVLMGSAFEPALASFIRAAADSPKIAASWRGRSAANLTRDLRAALPGLKISTMTWISGAWFGIWSGTIAFERANADAPIRVNPWKLSKLDSTQLANTMGHELAHAIGLEHPRIDDDEAVGRCEPPYVIGEIIEALAAGRSTKPVERRCRALR